MKRAMVGLPIFAWVVMSGGVAVANTIYQGGDYSYSSATNTKADICDKEADARTAYVYYAPWDKGYLRVNDADGSSGSCWESVAHPTGIYTHKTCEDINNSPDACSEYSFANHFRQSP